MPSTVTILLTFAALAAADSPPRFAALQSFDENAMLSMECKGEPPFRTMRCSFVLTTVLVPSEEEVKEKLTAAERQLRALPWQKRTCSSDPAQVDAERTPERKQAALAAGKSREASCKCADQECSVREMLKHTEQVVRACRILVDTFEASFQKVDQYTWKSAEGSKGDCKARDIATLALDPRSDWYPRANYWTFTTERLSADLSNPVCRRFPLRRPRVFTYKANRDGIVAPCSSLKFSNWGPYP